MTKRKREEKKIARCNLSPHGTLGLVIPFYASSHKPLSRPPLGPASPYQERQTAHLPHWHSDSETASNNLLPEDDGLIRDLAEGDPLKNRNLLATRPLALLVRGLFLEPHQLRRD